MRIVYRPREYTTPASELSTLAAVYKFVLDCRTKKEASRPGSPDAAKEISYELIAHGDLPAVRLGQREQRQR